MKKEIKFRPEGVLPLCPVCGRELAAEALKGGLYTCRCGEEIPEKLAINPVEGCTHGLNCNCKRDRKRQV